jgi:nucleotide-binding universal stress UspA family protein
VFRNVLVGVDGRPNGRDAIALASRLREAGGSLTLAHVRTGELNPWHDQGLDLVDEERQADAKLLEGERDAAQVEAKLISIEGTSPGRGLHVQAEAQHADLLAVGSCSRGPLGRAMLGDDTRAALNGAPCAVAIAARGYAEQPAPLARLGVAYDRSPESEQALATARVLAAETRATLDALEVVSIPGPAVTGLVPPGVLGETLETMLQEAQDRMRALPGVEGRAVYGLAGEELTAFSGEVDLLVIGSRGYGPLRRLVLGSTSDYLERHARSSLLVLPREAPSLGEGPPSPNTTNEGSDDE